MFRERIDSAVRALGNGPSSSSVASGSNSNPSHSNHKQHPSPPPSSHSQKNPPSDTDSNSESDSDFEPPSFLQLGVAPSSLPTPSSPFCYWCGTGEDQSEFFEELELAEQDPEDPEEITKLEGRLACSFCVKRTKKWIARGDGGEREMGELEKLAWVGGKLDHSGKKERATLVRMRDGGTAEED